MEETKVCPKCKDVMEKGHLAQMMGMQWVKDDSGFLNKIQGGSSNIFLYKCVKCNFVEMYIRE